MAQQGQPRIGSYFEGDLMLSNHHAGCSPFGALFFDIRKEKKKEKRKEQKKRILTYEMAMLGPQTTLSLQRLSFPSLQERKFGPLRWWLVSKSCDLSKRRLRLVEKFSQAKKDKKTEKAELASEGSSKEVRVGEWSEIAEVSAESYSARSQRMRRPCPR